MFISYVNGSMNDILMYGNDSEVSIDVSGRDDSMLKILAKKMNFRFKYFDIQTMRLPDNGTQLSEVGLQMLEERVREIFCSIQTFFHTFPVTVRKQICCSATSS